MKTIALIFLTLTSFLSLPAHAAYECLKRAGDGDPKNVTLRFDGNTYRVSVWGHSRNSYIASYRALRSEPLEAGQAVATLGKFRDDSTWLDMPLSLEVTERSELNEYGIVKGTVAVLLTGLGAQPIEFGPNDCALSAPAQPPVLPKPPHYCPRCL